MVVDKQSRKAVEFSEVHAEEHPKAEEVFSIVSPVFFRE
jgi:hypothetical protein